MPGDAPAEFDRRDRTGQGDSGPGGAACGASGAIPCIIPAIRGGPRAAATHHGGRGEGRGLAEELIAKVRLRGDRPDPDPRGAGPADPRRGADHRGGDPDPQRPDVGHPGPGELPGRRAARRFRGLRCSGIAMARRS